MSQNVRKRIHRIYGIVFTTVTLIAGICFIAACYNIYATGLQSGGQIYSRDIVSEAFSRICIPVYLCLALTIGGFVLHLLLPLEKKKLVAEKNRMLILSRLQEKADLSACNSQITAGIRKQEASRRLHWIITAVLWAVCTLVFLVYACCPSHWPKDLSQVTDVVAATVKVLLLCLILPVGYSIFAAYFCRRSMDKQIELMKQAAKEAPASPTSQAGKEPSRKWLTIVRCALVVLAVGLVLYGYSSGGIEDVIAKAAAICTECVGLG